VRSNSTHYRQLDYCATTAWNKKPWVWPESGQPPLFGRGMILLPLIESFSAQGKPERWWGFVEHLINAYQDFITSRLEEPL
jgi:hypothetical protein